MLFASNLQKQRVIDNKGLAIGSINDLVVKLGPKYPYVTAVVVKTPEKKLVYVAWEKVQSFEESEATVTVSLAQVGPFKPEADEVLLIKDILDKQIVDTKGKKLIRVQDIKLARIGTKLRVVAVDISFSGLLRRLGMRKLADSIDAHRPPKFIDWENVDILSRADPSLHLKVSHDKLSLLHPADIADMVNELSPKQRTAILESLDMEVAAETMEEMDPEFQVEALTDMENEKASHILEEMAPDDAADLLADIPKEKADELLNLMDKEEARELRNLLQHPENTAGGIMTTDFVTLAADINVRQAIESVRQQSKEVDEMYYLYITDSVGRLYGVLSLKQLITARLDQKIEKIMVTEPIKVTLETEQEEVARLVAKYNLLAIPVVDKHDHLHGIVTVDDAIDVVIPTAWKRRFPRIFA
ncbi:MAG: magnesium transporter [Actinobacteria bacterium]|nr:MAG: magnesium transporter [Actinomycetota bacterium]